jgi:hypothetical protein
MSEFESLLSLIILVRNHPTRQLLLPNPQWFVHTPFRFGQSVKKIPDGFPGMAGKPAKL